MVVTHLIGRSDVLGGGQVCSTRLWHLNDSVVKPDISQHRLRHGDSLRLQLLPQTISRVCWVHEKMSKLLELAEKATEGGVVHVMTCIPPCEVSDLCTQTPLALVCLGPPCPCAASLSGLQQVGDKALTALICVAHIAGMPAEHSEC